MKKILVAIILIIVLIVSTTFVSWYFTFVFYPKMQMKRVVSGFEMAVRNNDFDAILALVTEDSRIRTLPRHLYKEEFDKFYNEVEITWCRRIPEKTFPSNEDRIWANGRMKAKIDDRNRDYFEFLLRFENGEWKLRQFHFPDFVDY